MDDLSATMLRDEWLSELEPHALSKPNLRSVRSEAGETLYWGCHLIFSKS